VPRRRKKRARKKAAKKAAVVKKKAKRSSPEAALAEKVVRYLRGEGWTVYPEVQTRSFGAVADIVAVRDEEVMVIETKTTFGLGVLGQAFEWKRYAHYVAVGVPVTKRNTKAKHFGRHVCWNFGIGIFTVDAATGVVSEAIAPKKTENPQTKVLLDTLTEQHKTYAKAGNADKKYLTKFKITCNRLRRYVREHPDCCIGEAVANIKHHYKNDTNARLSLGKQITQYGTVPGITGYWDKDARPAGNRRRKGCLRLRTEEEPSPHPPRRKPLDSV
jgi:hypothetical protein